VRITFKIPVDTGKTMGLASMLNCKTRCAAAFACVSRRHGRWRVRGEI
jgi:hypothetical protein